MKVFFLNLFLLTLFINSSLAQTSFKIYYNSDYQEVNESEALYYEIGTKNNIDEKTGEFKSYYISGKLKEEGSYDDEGFKHGSFVSYYENGKISSKGNYKNGHAIDLWEWWHPNGKLKEEGVYEIRETEDEHYYLGKEYTIKNAWNKDGKQLVAFGGGAMKNYDENGMLESEGIYMKGKKEGTWKGYRDGKKFYVEEYEKGVFVKGTSYKSKESFRYRSFEQQALPEGDYIEFYKFIQSLLTYPKDVKRKGVEGKVYVEFVVEKDGSIVNPKIVKSIDEGLNNEVLRVIKLSPAWKPALRRGQNIKQSIVLPVLFKLGKSKKKKKSKR